MRCATPGEGAQRLGDRVVGDARARAAAVAAAAFSRLCAPGMRGSAGSSSSRGELDPRRRRPGPAPNPRGTTAVSLARLALEDPQLGAA